MDRDYNEDLKINEDDLSSEWLEQPSLYMYYAEAHAQAVTAKEKANDHIDLVSAQLDAQIRKDWEKHFDKYPTETAIKNWVLMQEKHKKALEKYHTACYNANLLSAAKSAFDHRRKALEHLVTLLVTGFHSEPKVSKHVTRRKHLGLRKKVNQ